MYEAITQLLNTNESAKNDFDSLSKLILPGDQQMSIIARRKLSQLSAIYYKDLGYSAPVQSLEFIKSWVLQQNQESNHSNANTPVSDTPPVAESPKFVVYTDLMPYYQYSLNSPMDIVDEEEDKHEDNRMQDRMELC
jgi:hypothetical protein